MVKNYQHLVVDRRGDIGWVTIHRPGDRNSINSGLMTELEAAVEDIEQNASRAIVFTGAGDTYFIGGADGVEMMQCDPAAAKGFSMRIQKLFTRMEASPLILVAAINGLCFGGGFEFALACDLRLAAENARIGLPEVKVGIIPGGGGTQRLPRLVGSGLAMQMILSGKLYTAREAHERGLVHDVLPADALTDGVVSMLKPMLRNPRHALAGAKQALQAARRQSFADGLQAESDAFSRCFERDYFVELMRRQLKDGTLKTTAQLPDWIWSK
jgi:enoyl-CoA hydratase/carnithine racemase